MSTRHLTVLLGVVAAIALAGCGGGSSGASSTTGTQAADLVSSTALALISVNTDRDGDQWQQADELLSRFPGRDKLLAQLRAELRNEGFDWDADIEPALGPELDIAVAYAPATADKSVVALMKPEDPEKLKSLAQKADKKTVVQELSDGWWALSDEQSAIDSLIAKDGARTLADEEDFQSASEDQPDESLVEAYVNLPRLRAVVPQQFKKQLDSVSFFQTLTAGVASIEAVADGVKLHGSARGVREQDLKTFKSTFLDQVPSGALAFVTFRGSSLGIDNLGNALGSNAAGLEQAFGVKVEDIQELLSGEVAVYVRPSALIPEVTIVATTDDEARAKKTLDALAQKLASLLGARTQTTEVGGITFTQIPVQGINISYAVDKGRIIVTDLPSGAAKLGAGGDSMADDPDFKAAAEAAGLPDETTGFAYVNVADALSILDTLASENVPADVRANLRPLQTLLLFGAKEGDKATVGGFLGIASQ